MKLEKNHFGHSGVTIVEAALITGEVMVFGLPRKLGGAFRPFKDASQGRRNCGTFRDF